MTSKKTSKSPAKYFDAALELLEMCKGSPDMEDDIINKVGPYCAQNNLDQALLTDFLVKVLYIVYE